ncbi:polyhydroxyalkanoate depolymerase [Roseomonas sp. NAR14]|uniref:Polyhydroxyalkanoate depolymerase n=1 Tax=Roseomonas acroporae TaxID=2937791 RepID=A0A9X1Y827_9PROT|nr:polyhydroxyalkanoate depolymerase [Roseomonas acroporae]MCK8784822.1 polyhydroxyalkanoate depolymerase [Roseomonas acroporae]
MNYELFQAQADFMAPYQDYARGMARLLWPSHPHQYGASSMRRMSAALDVMGNFRVTHSRPDFGISRVRVGNRIVDVREEVAHTTPFGKLLHFRKDIDVRQPRLLVAAPMSGHFATLLRGTVRTLLQDNDVYITDWTNARDVPLSAGRFDLDAFVDHIITFLEVMGEDPNGQGTEGPGSHVLAVCQPTVPVLAAVSVMAQTRSRFQPRSMTLMAGPIDTRISPTKVNELAREHPIEWFERSMIDTVPWRFQGAGRRVYPGLTQLTAFMSMNMERHMRAHLNQYKALVEGELAAAEAHRRFYEEYFAVMDLPAEFFLQTVKAIFQDDDLPLGRMKHHGETVRPAAIRRTAVLTVEGENDDICSVGQTMAALDLCEGIPVTMRRHHLQTGVGHYGVFNGKRWNAQIYPVVRDLIQATN